MKTKQIDQTQKQVNIVSAIIVAIFSAGFIWYFMKAAIMQFAANWNF